MIVKTGANYQNEGGYIEASREGDIITIDGAEYNDKYGVHSMAKLVIDNRTQNDLAIYAGAQGTQNTPPKYFLRTATAGAITEWQAFINQVIVCSRYPITLSDESVGCEVSGSQQEFILVKDVDALAVITNVG